MRAQPSKKDKAPLFPAGTGGSGTVFAGVKIDGLTRDHHFHCRGRTIVRLFTQAETGKESCQITRAEEPDFFCRMALGFEKQQTKNKIPKTLTAEGLQNAYITEAE